AAPVPSPSARTVAWISVSPVSASRTVPLTAAGCAPARGAAQTRRRNGSSARRGIGGSGAGGGGQEREEETAGFCTTHGGALPTPPHRPPPPLPSPVMEPDRQNARNTSRI